MNSENRMYVCSHCLSNPEYKADLSIRLCGDYPNDDTRCENCETLDVIVFDGVHGCEGCPFHKNCIE